MTGSSPEKQWTETDSTWLAATFALMCACIVTALLLNHYIVEPSMLTTSQSIADWHVHQPDLRTADHAP